MASVQDRAAKQILRILGKFPPLHATVLRPDRDIYKQPTNDYYIIAELDIWFDGIGKPSAWKLDKMGESYAVDGARWACVRAKDAPDVDARDIVEVEGKGRFSVRNRTHGDNIALDYWQLVKV